MSFTFAKKEAKQEKRDFAYTTGLNQMKKEAQNTTLHAGETWKAAKPRDKSRNEDKKMVRSQGFDKPPEAAQSRAAKPRGNPHQRMPRAQVKGFITAKRQAPASRNVKRSFRSFRREGAAAKPRDKSRNEDKKMVRSQGFEPWTQ